MEKILTVSVAAYNVSKYLQRCLDSFVEEKLLDMCEVLVINDGSTDNTAEIAQQYVDRYPDTYKLLNKENGGWGSTVNCAIKYASGKYFKLLDGDDYFDKQALLNHLHSLQKQDVDLYLCSYACFDDESGEVFRIEEQSKELPRNQKIDIRAAASNLLLRMHACTFKTELLKSHSVHITENCFYTDCEYVCKSIAYVEQLAVSDDCVYQYRMGRSEQSVSIAGYKKHYGDHVRMILELLRLYRSMNCCEEVAELIKQYIKPLLIGQYHVFFQLDDAGKHKKEIREFDRLLRTDYPEFYIYHSKKTAFLRKTNFWGISIVSKYSRIKEELLKKKQ